MIRIIVTKLLVLLAPLAWGQQNLVSNHSFENLEECPNNSSDWNIIEWIKPNGKSSDNFNTCASPSANYSASVPMNIVGFQHPHDGDGYVGIASFGIQYPNIREYVQTEMTDTLTGGIRYHVGFHASAADRWQYAISTLGAALTAEPPLVVSTWHPDGMLDADPQVLQYGQIPLTDTIRWVLISDTVLAQGGERYLTIGNFHLDGESDTVRFNPGQPPIYGTPTTYAYYYIDDVFVFALDSIPNSIAEPATELALTLTVWPNPATSLLHIRSGLPLARLRLLDLSGRAVHAQEAHGTTHTIPLHTLPAGLYLLEAEDTTGRKAVQRVVKVTGAEE
jgi:hypothetical protein